MLSSMHLPPRGGNRSSSTPRSVCRNRGSGTPPRTRLRLKAETTISSQSSTIHSPRGLDPRVGAGHGAGCVMPMRYAVRYAVLVSIAAAFPALAQTAATPGGVTSNGIVTLAPGTSASTVPATTIVTPTAAAQATPSTTTGGSATGSAGSGGSTGGTTGSQSSSLRNTGTTPSRAASGGSSGSATTGPSSSAPAWVVCPPSGSSGIQPFLAGTNLSCAP